MLVTGTIIIVASLSSLFYHWGILQKVVHAMAWVMRKAMRTSGSETLAAAANIFMGQTEAPLVIKPYVARMTRSELLCLMTGGMATIAGGVAAVYVKMGMDAGHHGHRRPFAHGVGVERAGGVADLESHAARNGAKRNRRHRARPTCRAPRPTALTRSAAARAKA